MQYKLKPHCRLSDFNKQIQEKRIHERPNLSNLLRAHFAYLETRHTRKQEYATGGRNHILWDHVRTGHRTNAPTLQNSYVYQRVGILGPIRIYTVYLSMAPLKIFQGYTKPIITEGFSLFCVEINARNRQQRKQVCFPKAQGQSDGMTSGSRAQGLNSSEFNTLHASSRSLVANVRCSLCRSVFI